MVEEWVLEPSSDDYMAQMAIKCRDHRRQLSKWQRKQMESALRTAAVCQVSEDD